MKSVILLGLFFILVSCDEQELGRGYYYLPDYEAMDIGYPYGSIIYKSKQKNSYGKILIYADVVDCKSSSDYIIALQRPNDSLVKQNIKDDLMMWEHLSTVTVGDKVIPINKFRLNSHEHKNFESIADILFNESPFFQKMFSAKLNYYIIDKNTDSIFGPLNEIEFESLKEEKNVDMNFSSSN